LKRGCGMSGMRSWEQSYPGTAGQPSIADVPVPTEGAPFTRRLVLRGEGDISVVARPLEELGVPTLLAGVQWLFAIVADYVLDAHERRREREAQLAIVSDEHAKKAELQAVRLLAEQLRARPEVVIAPGADPLVAAATRVFAAGDIDLTIPQPKRAAAPAALPAARRRVAHRRRADAAQPSIAVVRNALT